MKLHEIKPAQGATRAQKRVGRGTGSGHGKTSTRGHKGQWARSGGGVRPGFEGGQTPLYRRLPKKKAFQAPPRAELAIINVGRLNELFPEGGSVDFAALAAKGAIDHRHDGLRILGTGELKVAVNVTAMHVTPGAKEKIEAAGGSVEAE